MTTLEPVIREVREDDDFDQIRTMLMEHRKNRASRSGVRGWFFPETDKRKGYVAELDSNIIAFALLDIRGRDGVIEYAMQQAYTDNLDLMNGLVQKCANVIIERGGRYLSYFVTTEFGQLRTREIYLLERLGFRISDEYMRVSARLSMQDWHVPEDMHTEHINAEAFELEDVYRLMVEDGNVPNALIFRHQFRTAEPSNVFLTLRNDRQELLALAYYKVKKVTPGSDVLSAVAFNLHVRPEFRVTKAEKRRFLQGVLLSMRQLDVQKVHSLMSLKHADHFTLLVREGFDDIQHNFFALTKTVGSEHEKV